MSYLDSLMNFKDYTKMYLSYYPVIKSVNCSSAEYEVSYKTVLDNILNMENNLYQNSKLNIQTSKSESYNTYEESTYNSETSQKSSDIQSFSNCDFNDEFTGYNVKYYNYYKLKGNNSITTYEITDIRSSNPNNTESLPLDSSILNSDWAEYRLKLFTSMEQSLDYGDYNNKDLEMIEPLLNKLEYACTRFSKDPYFVYNKTNYNICTPQILLSLIVKYKLYYVKSYEKLNLSNIEAETETETKHLITLNNTTQTEFRVLFDGSCQVQTTPQKSNKRNQTRIGSKLYKKSKNKLNNTILSYPSIDSSCIQYSKDSISVYNHRTVSISEKENIIKTPGISVEKRFKITNYLDSTKDFIPIQSTSNSDYRSYISRKSFNHASSISSRCLKPMDKIKRHENYSIKRIFGY